MELAFHLACGGVFCRPRFLTDFVAEQGKRKVCKVLWSLPPQLLLPELLDESCLHVLQQKLPSVQTLPLNASIGGKFSGWMIFFVDLEGLFIIFGPHVGVDDRCSQ